MTSRGPHRPIWTAALALLCGCSSPGLTLQEGIEVAHEVAPHAVLLDAEACPWYPNESPYAIRGFTEIGSVVLDSDGNEIEPISAIVVTLADRDEFFHVSVSVKTGEYLETSRRPTLLSDEYPRADFEADLARITEGVTSGAQAIAVAASTFEGARPVAYNLAGGEVAIHCVLLDLDGLFLAVSISLDDAVLGEEEVEDMHQFFDLHLSDEDTEGCQVSPPAP
jgi:hypothetical protein